MFLDLLLTRTTRVSRSWNLFGTGFLLTAGLLCLCVTPTRAFFGNVSIVSIPEFPAEGGNVTLSVQGVAGSIREISWYRGLATDGNTRIFSYFPGTTRVQRNGVQYTQREFGFPNGSLLISAVRLSDIRPYTVLILVRPKGTLKGTFDLELARSGTTRPAPTLPTTDMPSIKEPTKVPLMLGWIVAGVVVGVLLSGALGAVLVYRFVLYKAQSDTGMAGKLDPKMKMPPLPKHGDKEPIYEVMDFPEELPKTEGKEPMAAPLPPLPGTCPKLDSNYMELLRRAESIYSEIKR
ncbi:carcinoembryonic antigen-related cell adhesion molecule 19 isoform X2 [Elgaria multicarinata webbii]|uniref:carcinoembryonic antigen-related cell adhesion molecule 19 isoform X2 n=1 Tax=Elgaria multicarinata webbii TaxID=159646 RepID=UPI002FCCEF4F